MPKPTRNWVHELLKCEFKKRLFRKTRTSARRGLASLFRSLNSETLERRELMATNVFNDAFNITNANSTYSPAISLNVLANDNDGISTQVVSAANIDYSASNKTANSATYFHPLRSGTSTPQRSMISGGLTFLTTSNFGDIDLGFDTDSLNNNSVPSAHDRTQGMILGTSRENVVPNNTGNTATNLQVLNYNSTYFSSVSAPGNDGEIMVRPGIARFPYSQGWIGGSYNASGVATVGNPNFTVTKSGTGQYDVSVAGVSDSRQDGFLFSIGEGNSDNYSRAVPLGGNQYRVVMRDNSTGFSASEDGGINLLYIPRSAQGLVGGHVRGDATIANPMIQSFGDFAIQRTGNGNWTMSVPGQTPESGILVIESADLDRTRGANVYFSYQAAANGNDFLIRQIQFEGAQTNLLNDDFVVFFIPFENQLAPSSPLAVTQVGTHDALGSGLSSNGVPVSVNPDKTVNYDYGFESLRALAEGTNVTDTFVYMASDSVESNTATATVTLKGVNDIPYLTGTISEIALTEDGTSVSVDLTTVFSDYDSGDLLSFAVTLSANSPVEAAIAGNIVTFTPIDDQYGAFSFTITATDSQGASVNSSLATGYVASVTEGAKAIGDSSYVLKNSTIDIPVLTNDYDPENSTYSVASGNMSVNVDATSNATTLWSMTQSSSAPNSLGVGSLQDLGDVAISRNGEALQQSLGVLLGTSADNTSPYGTVNTYGNILNADNTGYWVGTDRGSGGNGERNTPFSAAFFPFADGWTSGHVDFNGILRTGRGVTQSNIVRVTPGLFEITIPEASDSQTSGLLFATTGSNDDNILSVRPIPGTNRWQVRNNDNDSTTGFEQDGISFVYVPATTPNLIGGRWNAAEGSLVQAFGGITVTSSIDGTVNLSIPGHSPTSGALLAVASGTTTDTVNGLVVDVPSNLAVMHTPIGSDYAISLRLANTFTQAQGDVQFLFLPFANPLERLAPNPFTLTSFDSLSTLNATITQNPDGSLKYDPTNAGGAIAALGAGQTLIDMFTYTITDASGQTSTTTVSVTVGGDLILVQPTSGLITSESGATTAFDVVLSVAPAHDVTIHLASNDLTEGLPTVSSLVFTPENWNVPQTVTIAGQEDSFVDGAQNYAIQLTTTSADPQFHGVSVPQVNVTNTDNDVASIQVSPSSGLITTERGGIATFSVVLTSIPSAPVAFGLSSSDSTEGSISTNTLSFDSSNWNIPQIVSVTGVDDATIDGDITFTVVTDPATSADSLYQGLNPANVSVINQDFDINLQSSAGIAQYGTGQAGVGIDGRLAVLGTNAFLDGGTLTVTVTQNASSDDRLELRHEGSGTGQVGVLGSQLTYEGIVVASFSGGAGTPLVVTFQNSASRAALQAIARAVTYRDQSPTGTGTRVVSFEVVDGDAHPTTVVQKNIRVGLKRVLELQQGVDRGFGVYSGAHDIAISQLNPNTPLPIGSNPADGLLVDWPDDGATNKSQVLLRFDDLIGNALGQIPEDAIITSASLYMNINNTGDGALFHRMLQPWNDATATWNGFVDGVSADDNEANSVPESVWGTLDTSGASGLGFAGVSVTKDIRAWREGASNFGWLLEPHGDGTDGWGVSPSEAANPNQRPLLRVEWVPAGTHSVVIQQDVNGYSGTEDTQIAADLTTSQADSLSIGTDFQDATTARLQGLLRFNDIVGNSIGQIPAGALIHDAVLTLATFGNSGSGDGATMHRMNIDWSEDDLWTTFTDGIQTDDNEAAASVSFQAGDASLAPDAQAGLVDFEVIGDVQAWVNGTPNFGWVTNPWANGVNGWFFHSSENTFNENFTPRPKLEVFYSLPANRTPTDIQLIDNAIPENAPANAAVGTFSTIDPDAGSSFVYTLESGDGDTDNNAFIIDGDTLRASSSFDFETKSSYTVRVRSTDQGGLFYEKAITIEVENLDEVAPTITSADTAPNIDNNSGANQVVYVVTADDSDDVSGGLAFGLGSGADEASFDINPTTGAVRLVDNPDFDIKPSYLFTVTVSDGVNATASKLVTLAINNGNQPPIADDQNLSTNEDTAAEIVLTGSDPDGDGLLYSVVTGPTDGTLSGTAPNLIYIPNANFHGQNTIVFKVNDGTIHSQDATVTITVNPVNDVPTANSQTVSTNEDTAVSVLLTAVDVDGDSLAYVVTTSPSHGTLSGTAPNLTYTPAPNFHGQDSFAFQVNDGNADSEPVLVNIDVMSINDVPVAFDQSIFAIQETPVAIALNANDADGEVLNFSVMSGPANGVLSGTAPNLTYTPNSGFIGSDSFTFQANDGSETSNLATISIQVASSGILDGTPGQDLFTVTQGLGSFQISRASDAGASIDLGTYPTGAPITINGLAGDRDKVIFLGASVSDTVVVGLSTVNLNGSLFTLNGVEDLTIDGGQGDDSLAIVGRPIPTHIPKIGSVAAKNNFAIAGGEGNDTFSLDADFSLGKVDLSDLSGIDTISLANTTTNVTLNLGLKTVQTMTPTLSLVLASNLAIENAIGGTGNDTLIGNTLPNRLVGGAGNDTLIGMTGNDRYVMDGGPGIETITDSSGIDTIDYSASTLGLNVNLLTTTTQTLNPSQSLTLGTSIIEGFVGSQGNDIIVGNNSANFLEGAGGDDDLQGGLGNDTYQFNADNALGTDTINDATGVDTLDFSSTHSNGVTVSLSVATAQAVNSNLTLVIPTAGLMDNLVGSQTNDTLIGHNLTNRLTGMGGDDLLQGMAGNDTYWFRSDAPMGTDTIDDAAGTADVLDFFTSVVGVSVDMSLSTVQAVTPMLSLIFASTDQIENVTGSAFADMIVGNTLKNKIIGGAGDDSLNGGDGDDLFVFDTDVLNLGIDTINDNSGVDTLDFSMTTTRSISVNVGTTSIQSVNTNLSLIVASATAFENLIGGSLSDTLVGNSNDNRISGRAGDDMLVGGAGNDTYSFDADLSLGTDTLEESAGGLDTIDFTGTTTVGVTIDLSVPGSQSVTAISSLNLILGSSTAFERVIGTSQNDTIQGNASDNILQGMNGNDNLHGGDGRDLLIGGAGADTITGGNDDDILAVGTTTYDLNPLGQLFQVFAEWTGANDYTTRVNNLKTATGVPSFAKTTVVKKDTIANTLTGGAGDDLFYANGLGTGVLDTATDKALSEVLEDF